MIEKTPFHSIIIATPAKAANIAIQPINLIRSLYMKNTIIDVITGAVADITDDSADVNVTSPVLKHMKYTAKPVAPVTKKYSKSTALNGFLKYSSGLLAASPITIINSAAMKHLIKLSGFADTCAPIILVSGNADAHRNTVPNAARLAPILLFINSHLPNYFEKILFTSIKQKRHTLSLSVWRKVSSFPYKNPYEFWN